MQKFYVDVTGSAATAQPRNPAFAVVEQTASGVEDIILD